MSVWSHLKDIFGPEVSEYLEPKPEPRPKPRLRAVRRAPAREDFAQWKELPVTRFVMAAFRAQAQLCETTWHDQTWEAGAVDPNALVDLKARADTYMALEESGYEAFCDACGVDPEPLPEPEIDREQM